MHHLDDMKDKIARLRTLGAEEELERRWDEDDDYAERYNDPRLSLPGGTEIEDDRPAALKALYLETDGARFGDVKFRRANKFRGQVAVDALGEPIDDRDRLQIGDVGERAILLDTASGAVIVYWYGYSRAGWETGVVIECADVAEFVGTVALGPRYRELYGTPEKQKTPWWDRDPWHVYLTEIGMAG